MSRHPCAGCKWQSMIVLDGLAQVYCQHPEAFEQDCYNAIKETRMIFQKMCPEYPDGHHFNSDNTCACGLDTHGTQHPAETCVDCGAECGVQPLAGCVDAVDWEDGARCLDCSYKKCGEKE